VFWAKIIATHIQQMLRLQDPRKLESFSNLDICGPMSVNSLGGAKYYVIFIDNFNGYQFVFCIKNEIEIMEYFKKVKGESERVTRSDN
jgi:hypothetical protein